MKKFLLKVFATAILITGGYQSIIAQTSSSYKLNNANVNGMYNSAYGIDVLKFTTGGYNTAIGHNAIFSNGSGTYNVAAGYGALYNNSTGGSNVAVGSASLYSNINGIDNVAAGTNSLFTNNSGSNNVGIGRDALYYNLSGNYNVAVGKGALTKSLTSKNTAVGYNALNKSTSGANNTANGFGAIESNTTGTNNTGMGYATLYTNTTGSNNTAIGYYADVSTATLNNATAIGANAKVSRSNSLVLGTTGVNVGIGTSAPTYQLQLSTNSAAKPGSSTWTVASDRNLKKDITPFTDGLEILNKINPVRFSYNGKAGMPVGTKEIGVIAQEMKAIAPYTVGTFTYQDATGKDEEYLDYDANAVTYILINSVKEEAEKVKRLEQKIEELESLVKKLANSSGAISNITLDNSNTISQNTPNPFAGETTIVYTTSEKANNAEIAFADISGKRVKSIAVNKGKGIVHISANDLQTGMYSYTLFVDGKAVATKTLLKN